MPPLGRKSKSKLTPRQRAQRKYASAMRNIRKRAKTATGGRGKIGTRSAATKLRRKLGLGVRKARKVAKKTTRKAAASKKRVGRKKK